METSKTIKTIALLIIVMAIAFAVRKNNSAPQQIKKSKKHILAEATSATPTGMILIPAGNFIFGSDNFDITMVPASQRNFRQWGEDQKPEQVIDLPAYYIDKHEVTNKQYQNFQQSYAFKTGTGDHPAVNINWYDAQAYCESVGKHLPSEQEWEKAARGVNGSLYPWGDTFDEKNANTGFSKLRGTSAVGTFPGDVSYFNVHDMAGNVSEWTASWYLGYAGSKFENSKFGKKYKVSRGGSFEDMGHYEMEFFSSSTFRYFNLPEEWAGDTGFRCAK